MKVKCEYCDMFIDESEACCPHCGAINRNVARGYPGEPKTILELKKWYQDRNLPAPNITRFFIGEDITEAKAFGIYSEDDGTIIVYKNDASGLRHVHYKGTDETYGVHKLLEQLQRIIVAQKTRNRR